MTGRSIRSSDSAGPRSQVWRVRHQLPGYSPLPFQAWLKGLTELLPTSQDPRVRLRRILELESDAPALLLTDSGTSALQLALQLLSKRGRTPVAIPAYSCFEVATAVLGAQVPVLLYDLVPKTLSPDARSLEAAVRNGARGIVAAPLFGFPVDWDLILGMANRHDLAVVEDAAQGHGSEFRGQPSGALGDLTVLSFGRGKGWTGGGGGALVASDPEWGELLHASGDIPESGFLPEARAVVLTFMQWVFGRPDLYGLPRSIPAFGLGETRFHDPAPETAMLRVCAAIAVASRRMAELELLTRRAIAAEYDTWFRTVLGEEAMLKSIEVLPEGRSGYLRYPVLGVGSVPIAARRLGMEKAYPRTLGELDQLAPLIMGARPPLPGAESLAAGLCTLPTHSLTRAEERDDLLRMMRRLPALS